jgi:hypothetical protein
VIDANGSFSEDFSNDFEQIFEMEVGNKYVITASDYLVEATQCVCFHSLLTVFRIEKFYDVISYGMWKGEDYFWDFSGQLNDGFEKLD